MTISKVRASIVVLVIVGIPAVLALIVMASWWLWFQPAKRISTSCSFNDANYCRFLNQLEDKKSYTLTLDNGQQGKTLYETAAGNQHLVRSIRGIEVANSYSIGKVTYNYDYKAKRWQKTVTKQTTDIVKALFGPEQGRTIRHTMDVICKNGQKGCYQYSVATAPAKDRLPSSMLVEFTTSNFELNSADGYFNGAATTVKLTKGSSAIKPPA